MLLGFTKLSLVSVGGATTAWARELFVRQQKWMTDDEFLQARTLGQILPGPNMLNFAVYVGSHFHGFSGAFIALLGLTGIPIVIVMTFGVVYFTYGVVPSAQAVLTGLAAAAAGAQFGTGFTSGGKHWRDPLFVVLTTFVFITVGVRRWPMIPVTIAVTLLSLIIYRPTKKEA